VNGAAAVIKLRGRDQVSTPHGRRMQIQVTSSFLINCLARSVPLPDHMRKLMEQSSKIIRSHEPSPIVEVTTMEFASLRAGKMKGTISDAEVIIARALELDGTLLAFYICPPEGWEYKTIYTEADSDVVYKGRYDIYFDYWIAQIWNAI
jgi:hypothetical protein